MGRPEEALERDGSPVREFAFWLRDLRHRSGLTYQQLARAANYATSTMQAAADGRTLPTLKVTMAFVTACGGNQADWRKYWSQVKRALDTDSPRDITFPVAPPWAARALPAGVSLSGGPAPVQALGTNGNGGSTPARVGTGNHHHPAPGAGPGPGAVGLLDVANGWYVQFFSALLRMDTTQPEALEHRAVVATVDGVRELATSISVPRHPDDASSGHYLDAELLYGGSLEVREQPYESYFRHVIALARPLRAGQRHEYQLRLRVPPGQPMAPHYVYVPFGRCDRFELRVRFRPDRLPALIWELHGAPPAVIYERGPEGNTLAPDRFGEVFAEFRGLLPGHGYGIRWRE
jgi:hypothetical protein